MMHSTKPMIRVSSLIFTVTVGLLLGPFNLGNAADAGKPLIDNNGWCLVKKADKLQIAFVLDRTKSYEEFGIKLAKDVLPKVVDKLKSQYKEVTYALTTFADYTEAQGPVLIPRTDSNAIAIKGRDDLEDVDERTSDTGCYEFKMDFNSDATSVLDAISTMKYIKSGGSGESSFTAILFTAADKKLGWVETPTQVDVSPTSSATFKTIVVLTEETSTRNLTTDKDRTPVKGDGTDTCEATKLPTGPQIGEVLSKNNINLVAVVNEVPSRKDILETWVGLFNAIKIDEPKSKIYKWEKGDEEDVNAVVSAITSSLGNECEMADPPGNNMLGL